MPTARLGVRRRRRSTDAPRDGSPAWAGRGTGRSRGRAPRRRRGTGTARSRTGWPTPGARRPSRWRSSRCQPRGRTTSVAVASLSRYDFSGVSSSSVRRTRVARSPPGRRSTFAQVGLSASSRSAMNTRAPELRALIIILGSAGPGDLDPAVVEVGGGRRDPPVGGADIRRLGQERRALAGGDPRVALRAAGEQRRPFRPEPALEIGHDRERRRASGSVVARDARARRSRRPGRRVLTAPAPATTVASISPWGCSVATKISPRSRWPNGVRSTIQWWRFGQAHRDLVDAGLGARASPCRSARSSAGPTRCRGPRTSASSVSTSPRGWRPSRAVRRRGARSR